ncbi:MAG: hypothetical protein R3A45_12255 [Bdellovibrionota bacterium]
MLHYIQRSAKHFVKFVLILSYSSGLYAQNNQDVTQPQPVPTDSAMLEAVMGKIEQIKDFISASATQSVLLYAIKGTKIIGECTGLIIKTPLTTNDYNIFTDRHCVIGAEFIQVIFNEHLSALAQNLFFVAKDGSDIVGLTVNEPSFFIADISDTDAEPVLGPLPNMEHPIENTTYASELYKGESLRLVENLIAVEEKANDTQGSDVDKHYEIPSMDYLMMVRRIFLARSKLLASNLE